MSNSHPRVRQDELAHEADLILRFAGGEMVKVGSAPMPKEKAKMLKGRCRTWDKFFEQMVREEKQKIVDEFFVKIKNQKPLFE